MTSMLTESKSEPQISLPLTRRKIKTKTRVVISNRFDQQMMRV